MLTLLAGGHKEARATDRPAADPSWVAVQEFKLSYHNSRTIFFTIYIYRYPHVYSIYISIEL